MDVLYPGTLQAELFIDAAIKKSADPLQPYPGHMWSSTIHVACHVCVSGQLAASGGTPREETSCACGLHRLLVVRRLIRIVYITLHASGCCPVLAQVKPQRYKAC
jgi:hypothetical protein